jgi:hypothetical protein
VLGGVLRRSLCFLVLSYDCDRCCIKLVVYLNTKRVSHALKNNDKYSKCVICWLTRLNGIVISYTMVKVRYDYQLKTIDYV